MSSEEIFSVLLLTAKSGREEKLRALATDLAQSTRTMDEGCINYIFHQRLDNPREFVLYERWRDRAAFEAHVARLNGVYGPPAPGELFPDSILELIDKSELISLQAIE